MLQSAGNKLTKFISPFLRNQFRRTYTFSPWTFQIFFPRGNKKSLHFNSPRKDLNPICSKQSIHPLPNQNLPTSTQKRPSKEPNPLFWTISSRRLSPLQQLPLPTDWDLWCLCFSRCPCRCFSALTKMATAECVHEWPTSDPLPLLAVGNWGLEDLRATLGWGG